MAFETAPGRIRTLHQISVGDEDETLANEMTPFCRPGVFIATPSAFNTEGGDGFEPGGRQIEICFCGLVGFYLDNKKR